MVGGWRTDTRQGRQQQSGGPWLCFLAANGACSSAPHSSGGARARALLRCRRAGSP